MLDYSGNTRSHNIVDKLGPYYYAFAFEGTAPTNPSEIPFDLFVNSNDIVGYPVEDFRTLNWQAIYNNMVQANFVTASRPRKDKVAWSQRGVPIGIPKLGYYDYSKKKTRHIPKTANTNLLDYDKNSIVSENETTVPFPFIFTPGLNEFNTNAAFYAEIPEGTTGLYLECDFEKEVPVDLIEFDSSREINAFVGTTEIQRWDDTLNEGNGDWVTFHTVDLTLSSLSTIRFDEVLTRKIRFKFNGPSSSLNTRIAQISFYGATPTVVDTQTTIGWMLLVPCILSVNQTFIEVSPEMPYIVSAAGGPLDPREAIFSNEDPIPGRVNSLLNLEFKFVAKESF